MSLSIGIVGLPNVGKSTLFQTLTKKEVDRLNYPFCTIDPNVGVVIVPDDRVDKLAEMEKSAKRIFTAIEFVDIAGLVKGASQGEGLGNKFLSHIREVDAVIYLLRAFKSSDIIKTQEEINPLTDKEILDTELILKDMETVQKRINNVDGEARIGKKEVIFELKTLTKIKDFLDKGLILSEQEFSLEETIVLRDCQLLTTKPRLYLLNGKDEEVPIEIIEVFKKNHWQFLIIDILAEFDFNDSSFNKEDRQSLGLNFEPELDILIKESYRLLNLITFLTTGPDETRAWTVPAGTRALQAAGEIHSDFESHFIKAEVVSYNDLMAVGSYAAAREKGLLRTEGKEYVVQDGDVIEIKHNA
ncbi:redox-regulated ATPase YchF [Patescibacteria group bacterium]|nr:redox-regulated ATPase YchF [Patescibacteria group bacterium]